MHANAILLVATAGFAAAQSTTLNAQQSSQLISAFSSLFADLRTNTVAQSAFAALATDPAAISIAQEAQALGAQSDFYTNTAAAVSLYSAIGALPSPEASVLQSLIAAELSVAGSVLSTTYSLPTATGAVSVTESTASGSTLASGSMITSGSTTVTKATSVSKSSSSTAAAQTSNAANAPAYVKAAGAALGVFGAAVVML